MPNNNILRGLVIAPVIVLMGCTGIITTASPYGVGSYNGNYKSTPPKSTNTYIPLDFCLRANNKYDLRQNINAVTSERLKEFVSVGIRAISNQYGFDGSTWKIEIKQDKNPPPEIDLSPMLIGHPVKKTPLDYKVTLTLESPLSITLNMAEATKDQTTLLGIDKQFSEKYDYRAQFNGTVFVTLRSEVNDAIFFDVDANLSLKRKSHFADSSHFDQFETIDQGNVEILRKAIKDLLLQAYFETLNSYGLKVDKGNS